MKYARVPGAKGIRALRTRLTLPVKASAPLPLLIWLHSGGFRTGSIEHPAHGVIGAHFARHGIACAFIEYRLRSKARNLSDQSQALLPQLESDVALYDFSIQPLFTGPAAISAVEDCILFFQWLAIHGDRHGLGGPVMLGGSSAGAITALNTLFLAPHLGIGLPHVPVLFAMSGAFAYPSLYRPSNTRILAQHRPSDPKVPIASIRYFADIAADQCRLLEHRHQPHGGYRRNKGETEGDAIDRLMRFAQGTSTSDDLDL